MSFWASTKTDSRLGRVLEREVLSSLFAFVSSASGMLICDGAVVETKSRWISKRVFATSLRRVW